MKTAFYLVLPAKRLPYRSVKNKAKYTQTRAEGEAAVASAASLLPHTPPLYAHFVFFFFFTLPFQRVVTVPYVNACCKRRPKITSGLLSNTIQRVAHWTCFVATASRVEQSKAGGRMLVPALT